MQFSKNYFDLLELYKISGIDFFLENSVQNRFSGRIAEVAQKNSGINLHRLNHDVVPEISKLKKEKDTISSFVDNIKDFDSLCVAIKNFDGCEIKKASISTVIYDGCVDAKIMAIGEAPGANEDAQGIPFCGQSGKLLDNIFKSIGLMRAQNIFITNSVFWRPPGNRRPTSEEIEVCRPFLEKMIALIKPQLIIMVGSTAVESLIGNNVKSMNFMRSQNYFYTNKYLRDTSIETAVIFHPSYLLRQPLQKKTMWFDILNIRKRIEVLSASI